MAAKRTVTWTIVDGLQRLTALLVFLDNKIPAFGSYFKEYIDKEGGVVHSKEEIIRVKDLLRETVQNSKTKNDMEIT